MRYLRKPQEEQCVLQTPLVSLEANQLVIRSTVLKDSASSYAQQRDVEEVCTRASQALVLAERARAANVLRRILFRIRA